MIRSDSLFITVCTFIHVSSHNLYLYYYSHYLFLTFRSPKMLPIGFGFSLCHGSMCDICLSLCAHSWVCSPASRVAPAGHRLITPCVPSRAKCGHRWEKSAFPLHDFAWGSYFWDSSPGFLILLCVLIFLKSQRKAWTSSVSGCERLLSHLPRPREIAAKTSERKHPWLFFLFGKKIKNPLLSFWATANITTFLAGRRSYFVYVWTRILIDRVSCNPILNYRFSSRLMQQIVSK